MLGRIDEWNRIHNRIHNEKEPELIHLNGWFVLNESNFTFALIVWKSNDGVRDRWFAYDYDYERSWILFNIDVFLTSIICWMKDRPCW